MDPQPMGKVRDLSRLAGRVAARSTVRWSSLRIFLGICLLAAVVGSPAVGLPPAQGAATVAGMPRPAQAPALLPQRITFDPPQAAAVGQPVRLSASTDADASENLVVSFRSDTPDLCTVSGDTVTPTAPGFCVITATQDGDASYAPAPDVARAFLAHSGPTLQTITFDPPQAAAVGQPVRLSASTDADASENLVVSFGSDTPDVCTVSGTTVTPTTADVCTITASQGGNDRYAAARPMRRSFQALTGTRRQRITFDPLQDVAAGLQVKVSASTDAKENLDVSFRSESPMVCTVSEATVSQVTVTTIAAGACDITAYQGGSAIYAPAQASGSFQVKPNDDRVAQHISFGPVPGTTVGVPIVLTASLSTLTFKRASPPVSLTVSFTSQNRRVCTVSGATVVPRTGGRCVITAAQDGNARYLPAEPVTQDFPVARASQTVSFTPPASATIDQSVTLTATASSWLPVTYTLSTSDVCTVSGATLTLMTAGTCTVVASQPGNAQYAPADSMSGSFPVGKIPQTIDFRPPQDVAFGRPVMLIATASSRLPVSYSTDTPDVCTVSGSTLTPAKAGTCTVTASQPGDDKYLPARPETRSSPVQKIPQTIDFRPPQDVAFGRPVMLIATASSRLPVSYSTDTPDVCTVSGRTVTTRAAGTCAITASQAGDDRYEPARDAARTFGVERAAQAITFIPPDRMTLGQPVTLSASASSGLDVSYHADTPAVCTVSGATVSSATAGTCTITASQPGNDNYTPAPDLSRSFPIHGTLVRKTSQAIVFAQPSARAVGQMASLSASATSGLVVSFRSETPAVCSVSGDTVTAIAVGTCAVTASQAGDDRFAAARDLQRSFAVHVAQGNGNDGSGQGDAGKRASQTIFFGQLHAAAVGQVVALSASATSGLAVSVRSDTPAVCSVSGATVTTTTAGTCTVTASQAGDNDYLAAPNMTESFQVNAGHQAQTITFPPPPQTRVGEAATLTASATSGLLVAFRSDTPRICTVSGPTLTPIAAGTCTVTASQGGSDHYAAARDTAQSFDVASPTSGFPGALTILLGAVVFAAAGATSLVRRMRRSHRPPEPEPTVRADPVPGPPTLVSVQNTGAGVTHTVRIESSPGASITRIKEGKS
jgi:hypothetical protein